MKGKHIFTSSEINDLEKLILLRGKTHPSKQKPIRDKMRKIGFYGKDDWGITDMQVKDLSDLISSKRIQVVNSDTCISHAVKNKITVISTIEIDNKIEIHSEITIDMVLENFKNNLFSPLIDSLDKIADKSGNYIICLRKGYAFPQSNEEIVFENFNGYKVIYTGIAGTSLRTRDFKQHFMGNNAGKSTLRKSLGVLFGYKLVPRDKDPNTGKTKFSEADESRLSTWMAENLIMFFYPNHQYNRIEGELIKSFNPPLNLAGNSNSVNREFRNLLSQLRCTR